MTDCKSNYSNYKQYNNGDISKQWNYKPQPIVPPVISSIKTNVFGPFAKTGYQTLKGGYPHYQSSQGKCCTCNNVTRPTIWHK